MDELNIILVKLLLKEFDECQKKDIEYDWDGGHCYSMIKSDVYDELCRLTEDNQSLNDYVEDHCNEWMMEHEERPPCQIHVYKDGTVGSGCGCHDHLDPVQESEEIQDILIELSKLEKNEGYKYLITVEE
jgi:hypothetical protein